MKGHSVASVIRLVSALTLMGALAATAPAQSLGELAKREEARRKSVQSPAKVYTNDTVGSGRAPAPTAAPPAAPAAAQPGSPTAAAAGAEEKPKPPVDRKTEEAAWRQRMQGAKDSLQRSQTFAEALQSRVNALTADFTARDDPAQRAVVASDRQKALAELDRVKNDIAQQTKAIATIQEEARRAGVPPGWLR
jgi:hypothetical protein